MLSRQDGAPLTWCRMVSTCPTRASHSTKRCCGRSWCTRSGRPAVVLEEVKRELHSAAPFLPPSLQGLNTQSADCEEARLSGGECHEVLQEQSEVEFEASFRTLLLECLERLERVAPLRRDLGEREVRATELRAERVD